MAAWSPLMSFVQSVIANLWIESLMRTCLLATAILMLLTPQFSDSRVMGQTLEETLKSVPATQLAEEARQSGDAVRGAIVFHQQRMQCAGCHSTAAGNAMLPGPNLASLAEPMSDAGLVESILDPSRVIRRGYETTVLLKSDGTTLIGLLAEKTDEQVTLRDPKRPGEMLSVSLEEIEEITTSDVSLMPAGQVNQLSSRQQFTDLIRYLMEKEK